MDDVSIKKVSENVWMIEKTGKMRVPGIIFASEKLIDLIKRDNTLRQIKNVSTLPGIVEKSIAMPDAHQGYGFCIGGVAAFDLENGVISPGGVGYDINCGVRLIRTNIKKDEFLNKIDLINLRIVNSIPLGVGGENKKGLSDSEIDNYLTYGVEYAVSRGYGLEEDLENCEEKGRIVGAIPSNVSQRAKSRGRKQLGTLGAGNHFIEFQEVESIYDPELAKMFGLSLGDVTYMIHSGSRGLGHQVASDYIHLMEKEYGTSHLVDRELVYAPINSDLGQKYLSAMYCCVNFAFSNRQIMMHNIRNVLKDLFPNSEINLIYDVCHNVAKIEEHIVDGVRKKLCVHRKGATRSFENLPVIIPGSMGTYSYLMIGTKKAQELSFGSSAHGAGRMMSRSRAISEFSPEDVIKDLEEDGVSLYAKSRKGISEEAPQAYKDVNEVIMVTNDLGLAKVVARFKPIFVVKG